MLKWGNLGYALLIIGQTSKLQKLNSWSKCTIECLHSPNLFYYINKQICKDYMQAITKYFYLCVYYKKKIEVQCYK